MIGTDDVHVWWRSSEWTAQKVEGCVAEYSRVSGGLDVEMQSAESGPACGIYTLLGPMARVDVLPETSISAARAAQRHADSWRRCLETLTAALQVAAMTLSLC